MTVLPFIIPSWPECPTRTHYQGYAWVTNLSPEDLPALHAILAEQDFFTPPPPPPRGITLRIAETMVHFNGQTCKIVQFEDEIRAWAFDPLAWKFFDRKLARKAEQLQKTAEARKNLEDEFSYYMRDGQDFLKQKDVQEAEKAFRRALDIKIHHHDLPIFMFPEWELLQFHADRDDIMGGITFLQEIRARSWDQEAGYSRMGYEDDWVRFAKSFPEDWPGAVQSLRIAISLNPDYAECHKALAIILERSNQLEEAIEVSTLALKRGLHDGTRGGFEGRIKRLKKKMAKKI
jgi:tetratricopeptide (TPR) repeat protein